MMLLMYYVHPSVLFFREMSSVHITPVLDDEAGLKTKPNDIDQGCMNIEPDLDRFDKVYC